MSFYKKVLMDAKIVAILRGIDVDKINPLVATLYDSGIDAIEITLNSDGALEKIAELAVQYEGKALIGAGTVMTGEEARAAIEAGAEFIVSPILSKEVIDVTKQFGKLSVPAAFTPTEVFEAHRLGADIIKLFPASALAPSFIKDLHGPFNDINIMATGGIHLNNIAEYFANKVHSVGLGTSLLDKTMIANENWDGISRLVKEYMHKIEE